MFQCNSYEHSMKNAHMCPHFPYTCASLLQLSLLIVLSWIEFQNNYPHSQKILLMKEIPVQTESRVGYRQYFKYLCRAICTQMGGNIACFDISVKGEWREKGKPGGRREKVEGGKIQSAPV